MIYSNGIVQRICFEHHLNLFPIQSQIKLVCNQKVELPVQRLVSIGFFEPQHHDDIVV